jgi:hypothetical protein
MIMMRVEILFNHSVMNIITIVIISFGFVSIQFSPVINYNLLGGTLKKELN